MLANNKVGIFLNIKHLINILWLEQMIKFVNIFICDCIDICITLELKQRA